jgi:folate-binding protein YgfZ
MARREDDNVTYYLIAEDRAVLSVSGADRIAFLQGLVSNDVARVTADTSLYATLLTPQGKFLHDFFLCANADSLWLDCEAARRDDLHQRLSRYRLRAQVSIDIPEPPLAVALVFGDDAAERCGLAAEVGTTRRLENGSLFVDPRLPRLGVRAIFSQTTITGTLENLGLTAGDRAAYEALRIRAGVPDGSRDLPVENAILLENGIDALNGVDWDKGCYMGQELTARTHYRALVKRRLMPVEIDGPPPPPGTEVRLGDKAVGITRSVTTDGDTPAAGLALLRIDAVEQAAADRQPLRAGDAELRPYAPDWVSS